jgi:hypothetical protein
LVLGTHAKRATSRAAQQATAKEVCSRFVPQKKRPAGALIAQIPFVRYRTSLSFLDFERETGLLVATVMDG